MCVLTAEKNKVSQGVPAGFRGDVRSSYKCAGDNIKMEIEERTSAIFVWTASYLPKWHLIKS